MLFKHFTLYNDYTKKEHKENKNYLQKEVQ